MLWLSLEVPWWGASNEYPQHMFLLRNKKDISIFWMKKAPYLLLCTPIAWLQHLFFHLNRWIAKISESIDTTFIVFCRNLFVCDEILRSSQSIGVMSSAASLPNHTFSGQT